MTVSDSRSISGNWAHHIVPLFVSWLCKSASICVFVCWCTLLAIQILRNCELPLAKGHSWDLEHFVNERIFNGKEIYMYKVSSSVTIAYSWLVKCLIFFLFEKISPSGILCSSCVSVVYKPYPLWDNLPVPCVDQRLFWQKRGRGVSLKL